MIKYSFLFYSSSVVYNNISPFFFIVVIIIIIIIHYIVWLILFDIFFYLSLYNIVKQKCYRLIILFDKTVIIKYSFLFYSTIVIYISNVFQVFF